MLIYKSKQLILFSVVFLMVFFAACSKHEKTNIETTENIENPEFIDGVSQEEVIVPIDLDVQIIDGVMAFKDHQEMLNAMDILVTHNIESIAAWEKQIGFKSLFSEYMRIDELPHNEMVGELNQGRLKKILEWNEEEQFLDMPLYNLYTSRVFNTNGLIRVGEFVGTVGTVLNVWTKANNMEGLVKALNTNYFPNNGEFIIYDNRLNEIESRDWVLDAQCPRNSSINRGFIMFEHPSANRRNRARFDWFVWKNPLSNGNFDYVVKTINQSQSYKAAWNKYKTNHYHAHSFEWTTFNPNTPNSVEWMYSGGSNRKTHTSSFSVVDVSNVTNQWTIDNGIQLVEVFPGNNGADGHCVSHQGMGSSNYVRFECN